MAVIQAQQVNGAGGGIVTGASTQTIGPFTADPGFGNITVQITGTWTGTLGFFCGLDGVLANIQPCAMYVSSAGPGTSVTTTTANGLWRTVDGSGILFYIQNTATIGTAAPVIWLYANSIR